MTSRRFPALSFPLALALAALAALACLSAGCRMPAAGLGVLDGLDVALGNASAGQSAVAAALIDHLDAQQSALDAAFEADLRHLAAATQPDDPPAVRLDDVLEAKRLYDSKRREIETGRLAVGDSMDRLAANLSASREMVEMLRQLVRQQNLLAGQADLALDAILRRREQPAVVSARPALP